MPKKKQSIGRDIINKGGSGIISTPKDHEEFEKFKEEREKEKEEEVKKDKKLKNPMPDEVPDAKSPADLEDMEEIERLKKEGKFKAKNVHVREHHRGHPKKTEEEPDQ